MAGKYDAITGYIGKPITYTTRCEICGERLEAGIVGYMKKSPVTGKWSIICPACHDKVKKTEKAAKETAELPEPCGKPDLAEILKALKKGKFAEVPAESIFDECEYPEGEIYLEKDDGEFALETDQKADMADMMAGLAASEEMRAKVAGPPIHSLAWFEKNPEWRI